MTAITTGLQSFCNLTEGLASDGQMAKALPLTNLVPGGDAGFGFSDLCQSSIMAQVTNALNSPTNSLVHCNQLANELSGSVKLTNDRSATLAVSNVLCGHATSGSTSGTPDVIPLDLQVDRTVASAGINLQGSGNEGPISVTSTSGVQVTLHLDLSATFGYDWDKNFFYVVDTLASKPTLTATATISIPNGTQIDAGIGILQANLTGSLDGTVSFSASMSDPTGTGQMGFALGNGGAGNTALASAQLGSIFNVGYSGSLNGSMSLAPQSIGSYNFLPGDTATFAISIPDINNPPAQPFSDMVNFTNLLDNFENLTPRDLADGLGHLVQMIRGVEAAKNGVSLNVNLPFMKGSLSDATKIEESLVQFLSDHVTTTPPTTKPTGSSTATTYEQPDFSSIQDLVTKLTNYAPSSGSAAGSKLTVSGVNFDPTTNKLNLALSLSRTAGTAVNLDAGAQPADSDSSATYGQGNPPTLQDTSKTWTTNQWAGDQIVTADNLHSGIIASNTSNTLTLQAPWLGGTPTGGGYVIEGQDPKTGMVNFGNISSGGTNGTNFILNANASVPQATITPSYQASVTLVLDLEPAVTAGGCSTFYYNSVENPTNQACPFVKTNADGSQTVVNSLPTAPDRIMVRTADSNGQGLSLFSFDAPIDTHVSIDAQAGFLGVHLDGDLKECTTETGTPGCAGTADSGKHLIQVDLKPQADAQHQYDIPISEVFSDLTASAGPTGLLDASVNGQAYASLNVSVPDAGQFFGGSGTAGLTLTMPDITNPTSATVDASQLTDLIDFNFDPNNPQALFGAIVKGLQTVLQTLQNTPAAASSNSALKSALSTTIPGLNRSLKDILAGSEGGMGKDVKYSTSGGVGTITDSGKNWAAHQYQGRAVLVGTNLMMIQDNTNNTLTLTAGWSGAQPTDGTPYMINNELEAALAQITANPGSTLQSVVNVLNTMLDSNAVQFQVNHSNPTDGPLLELDIDWKRLYSTEAPIGFDLSQVNGIPSQLTSIAGIQAQGVTTINANAEIKLGLLVPLTTDASNPCYLPSQPLCITSDSHISAGVTGSVSGSVQVNVGPVAVALGNPSNPSQAAEANATLNVGLGDTTSPSGTIESIGTFLSNVTPSFDDGKPVTCPSDTANTSTDPLAVCAALPLYVQNGNTWNPVGSNDELFLRLPQTNDPTDTFNLNGAALSGGIPRVGASPDLSAIGADLAKQVLDLGALNGGIDGYFQFAENALNLASGNGKLPLVGNDLQQGSAFLTNLQHQFDSALGGIAGLNKISDVESQLNGNGSASLQSLLTSNNLMPPGGKVGVNLECASSGQLVSPTPKVTPTVDPSNSSNATTTYWYQIVAETTDGNGNTVAAPAGTAVEGKNIATLDATDFNTIEWPAADGATAYQIWRSTDGTNFYLLKDNATSGYPDNGTDKPGTTLYSKPSSAPCNPNAGIANITGITVDLVAGQGTVDPNQGCVDNGTSTCLGAGLGTPFDIGIPGLSLSAAGGSTDNLLSVKLGWSLHLRFGLDKTNGFFVCTSPKSTTDDCTPGGDNPIEVGLALSLPAQMKLNIAFLQMCVANHPNTDPCNAPASTAPAFVGMFAIQLNSPSNDGMITGADLAGGDLSDLVTPLLTAKLNIDWDFLVDTSAGSSLPGLGGEFVFNWSWTSAQPDSGTPQIEFKSVYIDAGTFLTGVLGKILDEVNTILGPIRPVINVLEAPIPVLSDLSEAVGGGPITLLTIAQTFSTLAGGPDTTAIKEVAQVVKFVSDLAAQIQAISGQKIHIPLGSFDVNPDMAKSTTVTPDNAGQFETSLQSCDPSPLVGTQQTSGCGSSPSTFGNLDSSAGGVLSSDSQVTDTTPGQNNQKYGFEFTALQHPASLLSVLMGKDAELFAFDSGPLTLAFTYDQQFGPVYAPPPVLVVISGSASISAHVRIGFDTKGIRDGITAAKSGAGAGTITGDILEGLYISTTDPSTGQPIPAITLTGTLAAGAEVSVAFISVGIEGGIQLTVNLLWNDPDNDGKLRFDEFLAGLQNPLCLFSFSGSLSAYIKLFIDIGFSPFDYSFSFDLVNVTLIDFSANTSCAAPSKPPLLGKVQSGVLYVYAGLLGTGAFRDQVPNDGWGTNEKFGGDEKFLVTELHDSSTHAFTGMSIDWQGHHQEFDVTTITTVEVDANTYAGNETITMTGDGNQASDAATFDKSAIVIGGTKNNVIKIDDTCPGAKACTVGNVYVDGGTGGQTSQNQINVGNATAAVAGGPGANQVQVGNGDDWVDGNGALTYSPVSFGGATIVDPSKAIGHATTWSDNSTTDGSDNIHVGLGQDTVWGGAGNNTISVANDSPLSTLPNTDPKFCNTPGVCVAKGDTIVGGGGMNHISSGSGTDTIWAGQYANPGADPADNWTGVSGDGYDSVDTGPGNKTVYGGSGGTFVQGHSVPGTSDVIYGGTGNDTLLGGNGNDKIYGEGGNDVIIGGTGSSLLVGGIGNSYIAAGGGDIEPRSGRGNTFVDAKGNTGPEKDLNGFPGVPDRTFTPPTPGAHDGHNTIIGGLGDEHIWGGNGGDTIYGHYQNETCAPPAAGSPPYAVQYDPKQEHAGEATDSDWIYGGPGDDTISGGGGTNLIDSGSGNDVVCGGSGNDTIVGHSTPTQIDRFYGISGRNVITGGNGDDILIGGSDDDTIYAGSGNSYIEGGDGANTVYAGGGNDAIIGGNSTAGTHHNADALSPAGPTGGQLYGGTGVAVIVGDNGCVDMTASGPEVSFPGQPVTVNSCNPAGSPNSIGQSLQVFDLDSGNPSYSENNYIAGGQGPSMIFGGLGSNTIIGGPSDDYIEGGTGNNWIEGGGGSNDIIGASSPNYLPNGTCGTTPANTGCLPAGANIIFGDDGTGGTATGVSDGSNAVIGDNGSITRAGVFPGWQGASLTSAAVNCDSKSCTGAPNIVWGDGSTVPNRTITNLDIYNGDQSGSGAWIFGGTMDDFLFGGPGANHIYGGPPEVMPPVGTAISSLCPSAPAPCIDPNGAFGNDYMEGGPAFNYLYSGGGQNDMIGGVSPFHLASGKHTSDVPNAGSYQQGGNGDNYLIADNGEIDHECGLVASPSVSACRSPSTPWTVDPNDGSYFRSVTLHDLLTIGANSTLFTGDGYDHAYGGIGNDTITGGAHDDYLMGGPGNNTIVGGTGSNDIIGGTAPEVLETGLTTAGIPSGHNLIYSDSGVASPADGANAVIGNNGDITRKTKNDGSGLWLVSNNDPNDPGVIQRNITNLDIYAYPLPAEPGTPDLQGLSDVIFGGTKDDILLGGPAGNVIYAGPPSAAPGAKTVATVTGQYFDLSGQYGDKHIEGGPGSNTIYGSGGDDDIIGGVSPLYLAPGHDTGTVGSLDRPNHPGNLLVGGTGNDYIAGANARIDRLCGPDEHVCAPVDPSQWAFNANDGSSIRRIQLLNLDTATGPTGPTTPGVGGDNTIYGTAGDNHLYGENGNNFIQGGPGDDYIEGGTGNNWLQGGGGDNDMIGGTSPASLAAQATVAASDAYVANHIPSGNNIICSFVCGRQMVPGSMSDPLVAGATSNDSVIVGHNGRIDRCAATVSGGVGTPQGSDNCVWQRTPYGNEKVSSWFNSAGTTGVPQTGQICTAVGPGCPVVSLGSPRTRFTTLIGQSPTETIQAGTDYIEGNIGNDVIYGEDGPAVIHGNTPRQDATGAIPSSWFPQYAEFGAPFLLSDECLPNPTDTGYDQNIIVGGYGGVGVGRNLQDLQNGSGSNDVLCGGNGDDAILGSRGLVGTLHPVSAGDPLSGAVTPLPFSNAGNGGKPLTIGGTSGAPYGTISVPASGNTIYPVRLDVEYVDGVLQAVPNWNNATATGQVNQHDLIFGGGGNNTIHGSPGVDFIEGGYGMHIAGTPAPCAAVPPGTAPPSSCTPTGDNIIFSGQGNNSVEGGPGNAEIYGGPGSNDVDVVRTDSGSAAKFDDNLNCLPMAFPTINVAPSSLGAANGYCAPSASFPTYQWANQSYASRFPAPVGQSYDADYAGRDNGGTSSHTQLLGQVVDGGGGRDIMQALGFGDRLIDANGAYNLEFLCPAAYGGYQINRAMSPGLFTFLQQMGSLDGAYNVNQTPKQPATLSSGDTEVALVYPGSGNNGKAYPSTPGHFTC